MISEACLKRALGRVALLRFFPQNNPEALAAVAELLSEMCADGAALARAVDSILRECSDWPGPSEFQRTVAYALYPCGMWRRGDKWIPSPENGPEYDIVEPNGARHWHDGVFYTHPRKPREGDRGAQGGAGTFDHQREFTERATVTPRALAGISGNEHERSIDLALDERHSAREP
jgi:hypothetical protein